MVMGLPQRAPYHFINLIAVPQVPNHPKKSRFFELLARKYRNLKTIVLGSLSEVLPLTVSG